MIKGLRTAIYLVPDMARAREWYCQVLGKQPYFDEPGYIGFDANGYELGLFPQKAAQDLGMFGDDNNGNNKDGNNTVPPSMPIKPPSVLAYWGVDDINAEHARLLSLGAREHEKITDVGGGIKIASVLDPFGNPFGLIQNPNFQGEKA